MRMRKGLLGVLMVVLAAWAVGAQETSQGAGGAKDATNVAGDFGVSSAAQVNLYTLGEGTGNFALAAPSTAGSSTAK